MTNHGDFPGKFSIRSVSSNLFIDGRDPGNREVLLYDDARRSEYPVYFQWTFEKVGTQYKIFSLSSKKYLDGRDGLQNERKDSQVLVTEDVGSNERWLLWDIESVDGNYAIKSNSSGLYLDGTYPDWQKIWLTNRVPKGDHYLQWIIKPDFDKEEEFHIQSVGSGQWLNGRAKAGQFAYISREPDVKKAPDYFKWTIEKVGNQYRFLSKTSKCYLDGRDSGYGNQDNVVGITPSKPSSERYLLWDLVTIDGNYCLKSDSSGFWLDGRNDNFTGDQLWLSPRTPSSGDDALIWKIYKV